MDLIESILQGDLIRSNELFEARMIEIREKKLYEVKRSLDELWGYGRDRKVTHGPMVGKSNDERRKMWKDTINHRKSMRKHAASVDGEGGRISKAGIEKRRKDGYLKADTAIRAKAFIDKVHEYLDNKSQGKPTYVGWGMNKERLGEQRHLPFLAGAVSTAKSAEKLAKKAREPGVPPEERQARRDRATKATKKSDQPPIDPAWDKSKALDKLASKLGPISRRASLNRRRKERIAAADEAGDSRTANRLRTRPELVKHYAKKAANGTARALGFSSAHPVDMFRDALGRANGPLEESRSRTLKVRRKVKSRTVINTPKSSISKFIKRKRHGVVGAA